MPQMQVRCSRIKTGLDPQLLAGPQPFDQFSLDQYLISATLDLRQLVKLSHISCTPRIFTIKTD